ncbi:50S ribosomal protein L18, partial [Pseudoalteromonas sp. SIMBA_153]
MFDKKAARLRRAKKTRAHIRFLGVHRLTVNRTSKHIYAQIISPNGGEVIA